MVKNASGKNGYRSFTIINATKKDGCTTKFHGGKYISKSPMNAAKKAFSELCRVKDIRGVCTLNVSIQETTQGSNNKVYTYRLHRKKLKNPIIMTPTQIAYDLSWTVKALNLRAKTLVKANPIPPIMA